MGYVGCPIFQELEVHLGWGGDLVSKQNHPSTPPPSFFWTSDPLGILSISRRLEHLHRDNLLHIISVLWIKRHSEDKSRQNLRSMLDLLLHLILEKVHMENINVNFKSTTAYWHGPRKCVLLHICVCQSKSRECGSCIARCLSVVLK